MQCSHNKSHSKSKCFKIALIALVGISALGWVVMLLWNWLMPDLFIGAKQISYCQALGVLLLSKILFGNFRGKGRHHHAYEKMTTEEREQFKSRWGRWCCTNKTDARNNNDLLSPNTKHE